MFRKVLAFVFLSAATVSSPPCWAAKNGVAGSAATYSLSPGVVFLGNIVGPSFSSYIGVKPLGGHEFYVGGDVGVALFFPSAFVMSMSLLPAAWYQFKLPSNPRLRLVAGISFGPNVIIGAGASVAAGVTYEFMFRPGFLLETGGGRLIGGDLKFGVIGGAFTFRPMVNFVYPL